MASSGTNRAAKTLADRLIAGKSYKMILLISNTTGWQTAANTQDFNFAEDITDDEADDASYARADVTLSTSEDDTNNRGEITYADATFDALEATTGPILGVAIIEVVNDDTDHILYGIHDVSALDEEDRTPDGEDFIVRAPSEGAIHIEHA
jgi:hypothetical protein